MMKTNIFVVVMLVVGLAAWGATSGVRNAGSGQFKISDSMALVFPPTFSYEVSYLPSGASFVLTGKYNEKDVWLWLATRKPETLSNRYSAEKLWHANLDVLKVGQNKDKRIEDQGCEKLTPFTYHCKGRVAEGRAWSEQNLIWNGLTDLVALRITGKGAEALQQALRIDAKIPKVVAAKK